MKPLWSLITCAFLAACGSSADSPFLNLAKTAVAQTKSGSAPVSMEQQRADLVAKVRADPATNPVLLVELPERHAVAGMVVAGENRGTTTWFDATGIAVMTRQGVVTATRGLGWDLMSANVSGTLNALRGGAGQYNRVHTYLDGEGQTQEIGFRCEMTHTASSAQETCRDAEGSFRNVYEMRAGQVVRSRQWLGHDVGVANLTRLR